MVLLADEGVPAATVEKLARDGFAHLAVIATEALRRRGEATSRWESWAVRRLGPAGVAETRFLLRTLGEIGRTPVLVPTLALVDASWEGAGLLGDVAAFVTRRIAAGETIDVAELQKQLDGENELVLVALLDEFPEEPPAEYADPFALWHRSLVDLEFIRTFGRFLEPGSAPPATLVGGRERAVDAIVEALSASPRRSLLLVGERGVGKTSVALEAFRLLATDGWLVFTASASAVNAGQVYVGELEGRVQELARRTEGRPIVWLLPHVEEALYAGQHSRNPHGLLDAVLPYVETGQIALVGEVDPLAYELLVQQRPQLATAVETVRLAPLPDAESLAIARAALDGDGPRVGEDTLREAHDLAEHYLPGIAAPGGLLRLVQAARARVAKHAGEEVRTADVLETLAEATGLPLHLLDPHTPMDVDAVRAFFAGRVLGQPEAVETLVERIAMIKAGVTDPTRPLGVFLFVGPTGTGKTEIAKAFAEFLFGSADRLVRLDMSEFQTYESIERLLADRVVETQAAPLVAAVRREPFSVVLLDEFEKAHENIWDVFLQVFDDGRLTDMRGRTVDFRHCVIVLTSNIGSALPMTARTGFAREPEEFVPAGVERKVARWFRPEFLNRLDRIVVFRPLGRDVMRSLLEHELSSVLRRRGFRMHPWAVEWDESAIDFLLEKGFTAELGARPLKRAVERHVLAPLALAIVARRFPEGDQFLFISARDGERLDVKFIDPDAHTGPPPAVDGERPPLRLESIVLDPHGDRAEVELVRSEAERQLARLRDGQWPERKEALLASTREPGFWESDARTDTLALVEYLDRIEAAGRTAEGLLRRLGNGPRRGAGSAAPVVSLLAERVLLLDRALSGLERDEPADAFVLVSGEPEADAFVERLLAMYEGWAAKRGMRSERFALEDGDVVLAVSGLGAYTVLAGEAGVHVLEIPVSSEARSFDRLNARVVVAPRRPGSPDEPPAELAARALAEAGRGRAIVRRYREEPSPLVRDSVRGWRTGRLDRVLAGEFDVIV